MSLSRLGGGGAELSCHGKPKLQRKTGWLDSLLRHMSSIRGKISEANSDNT